MLQACDFCKKGGKCTELARREYVVRDHRFFVLEPKKYPQRNILKGLLRGKSLDTEDDLDYVVDFLVDRGVRIVPWNSRD